MAIKFNARHGLSVGTQPANVIDDTGNISTGGLTLTGTLTAGGSTGTAGQVLQSTASGVQWTTSPVPNNLGSFGVTIDGEGSPITSGIKGYITIPYNCTIASWTILADVVGSIVIDIWKDTYANYPPTVEDSIAGTEKPFLNTAIKNQDVSLSSWNTSVLAGDIIGFNVESANTVTKVTLVINTIKE